MAVNNKKIRKALAWFFYMRNLRMKEERARDAAVSKNKDKSVYTQWLMLKRAGRKRMEILQAILACAFYPRIRDVWERPRSFAWFEMVDTHFTDEQWYENFRVTKGTFAFILSKINKDISHKDTVMRKAVQAKQRLAITLYFLASVAEYKTIANLFGVSDAFVCMCVKEVCQAIRKSLPAVVTFPKGEDLLQIIQCYEEKWGFPMCAGTIDGTHVPVLAPSESHIDYVNRKGQYSIVMQAIVDCNYMFRDIIVGWPGSVHDARILSNSGIFRKGNSNKLFREVPSKLVGDQEINPVIIGDPAYPLLSWLTKPYPENFNTLRIQRVFNYRLSRARMTVENAFGRWKGRFIRFTKRVDIQVSNLGSIVAASCILHNICEVQNNAFLPHWELEHARDDPVVAIEDQDTNDAVDIRDCLAEYLMLHPL